MSEHLEKMMELGTELARELFPHDRNLVVDDLIKMRADGWHSWFWSRLDFCLGYLEDRLGHRSRTRPQAEDQMHIHRRIILGALVLHRSAIVFQRVWELHDTRKAVSFGDRDREIHTSAARASLDANCYLSGLSFYPLDMIDLFQAIAEGAYFDDHPSFPSRTYDRLLLKRVDGLATAEGEIRRWADSIFRQGTPSPQDT